MIDIFPREYSSPDYLGLNPDLSNEDLESHWSNYGWKENRLGQFILTRNHLKGILDRKWSYLEIGPYGRPFIDKNTFDVKYFDVLNQEELRIKSIPEKDHHENNIPYIDYVHEFGDLCVVTEKFDCVFSSHCIEHQPNILSHLKKVSNILRDKGVYICIIPNYKYCFDRYKPCSTLIDVIEAHLWIDKNHSQRNILLQKYYCTHNNPALHWESKSGRIDAESINVNDLVNSLLTPEEKYTDCHAWFFDEQNFSSIFMNQHIIEMSGLELKRCYQTPFNSNEFIAIFEKKI